MAAPNLLYFRLPVCNSLAVAGDRAPCSSLLSKLAERWEMPVPQWFLTFLAAGSLFFSKITLILAK
jgi:hypothetical protein